MVFGEGARGPGRVALRQAAGVKQASLRHQGALVGRLPVADTASRRFKIFIGSRSIRPDASVLHFYRLSHPDEGFDSP